MEGGLGFTNPWPILESLVHRILFWSASVVTFVFWNVKWRYLISDERSRSKVKIKTRSFKEARDCVYIYRIFFINGSRLFCSFLDNMNWYFTSYRQYISPLLLFLRIWSWCSEIYLSTVRQKKIVIKKPTKFHEPRSLIQEKAYLQRGVFMRGSRIFFQGPPTPPPRSAHGFHWMRQQPIKRVDLPSERTLCQGIEHVLFQDLKL